MGPIIDRYGPRWVLAGSFTVLGSLLIMMAAISTLWHLYTLQVLARVIAMGAIGLTILSWGLYGPVIHQGQHDMPYEIPGGGNVRAMLLPFFFDPSGSAKRVGIFVNGSSYYCLENGGINLGNYEVQFDYFPINFKESFQPPIA